MKIKKIIFLLIMILFPFVTSNAKKNTKIVTKQKKAPSQEKKLNFDEFLQEETTPLEFCTKSMKSFFYQKPSLAMKGRLKDNDSKISHFNSSFMTFIKQIYNRQGYGEAISQDGTHIIEFLEISNELDLDLTAVYVSMRLFHNKIKSSECELIDDSVILQLLKAIPSLLKRYFNDKEAAALKKYPNIEFVRKNVENSMLDAFTKQLPYFQQNPDHFISDLAKKISISINEKAKKALLANEKTLEILEDRNRLRQTIIRFLETAIGRTIWSNMAHEGIWGSFVAIANGLQLLGSHMIIDHMDDLDDLLWSLVHRFCWFLDFSGALLPLEFFDEVELELSKVAFLEEPEQDDGITTKKETLKRELLTAKAKAVAQRRGIVTQHLAYH